LGFDHPNVILIVRIGQIEIVLNFTAVDIHIGIATRQGHTLIPPIFGTGIVRITRFASYPRLHSGLRGIGQLGNERVGPGIIVSIVVIGDPGLNDTIIPHGVKVGFGRFIISLQTVSPIVSRESTMQGLMHIPDKVNQKFESFGLLFGTNRRFQRPSTVVF